MQKRASKLAETSWQKAWSYLFSWASHRWHRIRVSTTRQLRPRQRKILTRANRHHPASQCFNSVVRLAMAQAEKARESPARWEPVRQVGIVFLWASSRLSCFLRICLPSASLFPLPRPSCAKQQIALRAHAVLPKLTPPACCRNLEFGHLLRAEGPMCVPTRPLLFVYSKLCFFGRERFCLSCARFLESSLP